MRIFLNAGLIALVAFFGALTYNAVKEGKAPVLHAVQPGSGI